MEIIYLIFMLSICKGKIKIKIKILFKIFFSRIFLFILFILGRDLIFLISTLIRFSLIDSRLSWKMFN